MKSDVQWKLCGKVIGEGYVHQWWEALSGDSTRKCRRQVYRSTRGKRFRKGRRRVGVRLWNRARFFESKTKSRGSAETRRWMAREKSREASSGKNPARRIAKSLVFSQRACERTMILSARSSFRFLFFIFLFFFFREHFLAGNRAAFFRNDLQSSTPEEYLDGWILADEASLGDGPLAVEGDGSLPA